MKETFKKFYCEDIRGIYQYGISQLNLEKLYADNNKQKKNVNHMAETLKILHCRFSSGIDQYGISQLNLKDFDTDYNDNIKLC